AKRPPGRSAVVGCCAKRRRTGAAGGAANVHICGDCAIQRGWNACRNGGAAVHASGGGGRSRQRETQEVPTHGCSDHGRVGPTALFAGLLSHHSPLLTCCREGERPLRALHSILAGGTRPLATFPSVEWERAPLACCTVLMHGR